MKRKKNGTPLKESDEWLHQPDDTLKWRESYYFNWVDIDNKISGFSTIGIVPNEKRREFVFVLFIDDRREFYYQEPMLAKYSDNFNKMLQYKRLSYRLVEPLQTWEIIYDSRKFKFNLTFDTRFKTHNFGTNSSGSWHEHYESSGLISGKLTLNDGIIKELRGYGQRDKSWGYRDCHVFDKWYAGHFQFKDWTAAFRKDHRGDKIDLSGYIANKAGTTPITSMEINTINDTDKLKSPIKTTYKFSDIDDNSFIIEAHRINKNSYIRFARNFPGGFTELFEQMVIMKNVNSGELGTGMSEQLRTIKI